MKNYRITVNGVAYEVSVEELGEDLQSSQDQSVGRPAPAPAPAAAPAKKKPEKKAAGAGSIVISAPMPGKILAVKVSEGDLVHKGDAVLVLEAMKMENEIYAAEDGQVASIEVSVGDMVEGGATLITMN